MSKRKLVLYVHLIWNTRDGVPWIKLELERGVYRCIVNEILKLNCQVLAINSVPDHVHLVVKLKSTVPIALIAKQAKGVSARFINDHLIDNGHFSWEAGYGAFTISRWDLPKIINYVKKQKIHHHEGLLDKDLEFD